MFKPAVRDRITLPDEGVFEVIGVADYNHGFHQWHPDFPKPYVVQHHAAVVGAQDALGNDAVTWGNPVAVRVSGWAHVSDEQVGGENSARELTDVDLFVTGNVVKLRLVEG